MSRHDYVRTIQQPTFEMLAPILLVAFGQSSHGGINFSKADFDAMGQKGAIWLGAYEKSELIGCVAVTHISPARARINKLAVLPDKRGTGLGSYLVLHAEREIFASGIRKVELVCQDNEDGLVDFYKRQGYKKVKEKQNHKTEQLIAFMEKRMPHLVDQVGSRVHAYELSVKKQFQKGPMEIVLLYHPDEIDKPSNTGHVIQRCLPEHTKELIWHRNTIAAQLEQLAYEQGDYLEPEYDTVLLYPSKEAVPLGECCYRRNPSSRPLRLIVLDGTWQQVQKMMLQSPALRALPAVKLVNIPKSRYHLRKNQKPMGLCTLESVGEALAEIGHEELRDHLMNGFQEWLELGYERYK